MSLLWIIVPAWIAVAVYGYRRFRSWRARIKEHALPLPTYELARFTVALPDGDLWPVAREETRTTFGNTARSDVVLPKSKFHDAKRPTSFAIVRENRQVALSAKREILIDGVGYRNRVLIPGDKIFFDDLRIVFDGIGTVETEKPPAPRPDFALLALPLAALLIAALMFREPIPIDWPDLRIGRSRIDTTPAPPEPLPEPSPEPISEPIPEAVSEPISDPLSDESVSPDTESLSARRRTAAKTLLIEESPIASAVILLSRAGGAIDQLTESSTWPAGRNAALPRADVVASADVLLSRVGGATDQIVESSTWPAGRYTSPPTLARGSDLPTGVDKTSFSRSGATRWLVANSVWPAGRVSNSRTIDSIQPKQSLPSPSESNDARFALVETSKWPAGRVFVPEVDSPANAGGSDSESVDSIDTAESEPRTPLRRTRQDASHAFAQMSTWPAGAKIVSETKIEIGNTLPEGSAGAEEPGNATEIVTTSSRSILAPGDEIFRLTPDLNSGRSGGKTGSVSEIKAIDHARRVARAAKTIVRESTWPAGAGSASEAPKNVEIAIDDPVGDRTGSSIDAADRVAVIRAAPRTDSRSSQDSSVVERDAGRGENEPTYSELVTGTGDEALASTNGEVTASADETQVFADETAAEETETTGTGDESVNEDSSSNGEESAVLGAEPDFATDSVALATIDADAKVEENPDKVSGAQSAADADSVSESNSVEGPDHERSSTTLTMAAAVSDLPINGAYVKAESAKRFQIKPLTVFGPETPVEFFDADIMFIHAHPDDEAIDFGGLMARMSRMGRRIVTVIFTDGESGLDIYPDRFVSDIYPARDLSGSDLAAVRTAELERSLLVLGSDHYVRLGLLNRPYGGLVDVIEVDEVIDAWGGSSLVNRIAELIEGYRPEIVVSPDGPTEDAIEHFEHEAVGAVVDLAIEELIQTRRADFMTGHLVSVDPRFAHLFEKATGLDVTGLDLSTGLTYREIQIEALKQHITQRDATIIAVDAVSDLPHEYYITRMWRSSVALDRFLQYPELAANER